MLEGSAMADQNKNRGSRSDDMDRDEELHGSGSPGSSSEGMGDEEELTGGTSGTGRPGSSGARGTTGGSTGGTSGSSTQQGGTRDGYGGLGWSDYGESTGKH